LARPHLQPVPGSLLPEAAIHDRTGIASSEAGDEQPNEPVHSALSRTYEDLDRALDELADRLIARQREERETRETRENAAMHTDAGEFIAFKAARN
jgi:hypothetical protein